MAAGKRDAAPPAHPLTTFHPRHGDSRTTRIHDYISVMSQMRKCYVLQDVERKSDRPSTAAGRAFAARARAGSRARPGARPRALTLRCTAPSPRPPPSGSPTRRPGSRRWIVEKLRAWSDCGGEVERRFTKDEILTNVTLDLFYRHDRLVDAHVPRECGHPAPASLPAGSRCRRALLRLFARIHRPPTPSVARAYGERRTRATEPARGGHFAPFEEPEIYAEELRASFSPLPGGGDRLRAPPRVWRWPAGLAQVNSLSLARNSPESAGSLSHPARDRSAGCHSHDDWATLLVQGR